MKSQLRSKTSTIDIYIKLAQFPILADVIRKQMREELFQRGIVKESIFEEEVEKSARDSQYREGLIDPFSEEPATIWEERKARIRAFHTDYYFAYNLPTELFEEIVRSVLEQRTQPTGLALEFNPELAPWEMLFKKGEIYEKLPPHELEQVRHHLEEIKVVLIRGMISDQLPLIAVARRVLSISDLHYIYNRRIGGGKIGGKAAGLFIAYKILQQQSPEFGPDISASVGIPESFFLGTDVMYEFRRQNNLDHIMNQKYKPLDVVRDEYPAVVEAHLQGRFPEKAYESLRGILSGLGRAPLIVRSSSLLEDNFGSAFAGKYESHFCPNQGTLEENVEAVVAAIKRVYASTLNPDAILYRQKHGLIDYDERMAILIQQVEGQPFDRYFFPTVAGVGFSQNPFRWNPDIRREDGFLRVVWGLGTRAVERVAVDYPRLISLSHPKLRPETTARAIRQYSQRYVDVIDLQENRLKTIHVRELMNPRYSHLRFLVSIEKEGYIQRMVSIMGLERPDDLVVTFDYLTHDEQFVKLLRTSLRRLEHQYGTPVDTEFAVRITATNPPEYKLYLFQCRPLSQRSDGGSVEIPATIPDKDMLFVSRGLVPDGKVEGIRYAIFIDPLVYRRIREPQTRLELGRVVGRLNQRLGQEKFIILGPGRWGSSNIELGVKVSYADIHNTQVLIEIAMETEEGVPELSYGTHFFQDLVEAGIHALPLHLHQSGSRFKWEFFRDAPNVLPYLLPQDIGLSDYLRVVDIAAVTGNRRLNIIMNGQQDEAVGFLVDGQWEFHDTAYGATLLSNF